ncbi:uncharacterized protein odam [Electrophorus electricus]|uniref:uncharacterized protein odam n=1 Tax=Electrophorus electricus TaxID=8005 RepID=UPI000F0A939C|nr:uncharacterized protein odam [Electrophorus electricus]
MNLLTIIPLATLLSCCTGAPILQPQLGIIASNSNEILRINGLTLSGLGLGQAQGMPFLPPFLIQQQPDILLPPQLVNFGAQVPGPFLTPQQNQLPPVMLLPSQQEQPTAPLNPNNPTLPQNPAQGVPQFYPYPQGTGGQGFPYYLTYGFPLRNTLVKVPPTQKTGSQIPVRPTQGPLQPIQNNVKTSDPGHMTPPPDNRGDRPGPGVEGDPAFAFFEP